MHLEDVTFSPGEAIEVDSLAAQISATRWNVFYGDLLDRISAEWIRTHPIRCRDIASFREPVSRAVFRRITEPEVCLRFR